MAKILSIDLGTSYFKMSVFDRNGHMCDTCRLAPPVITPRPGHTELPADGFADLIAEGIAVLRNRAGSGWSEIEVVTCATQTNSFILLDAGDRPLTPLILWTDRRAEPLEEEVRERCELPVFSNTTGFSRINFQCMPAKLLWLQRRLPAIWRRTHRVCLIGDYLAFLLTGRRATEAGAAGLTGLVDIHRCQWYTEMLSRFEIDERWLPDVVAAGTDLGPIDSEAAERFGLPASCRFVVGCLDQYAGAIGAGNVEPGMISETTGTVLAAVCCADRFSKRLAPAVLQGPAYRKGLYWRMAFSETSANYLEWYRNQLPDRPGFDRLLALAEPIEPGAGGLRLRTDVELSTIEEVFAGLADEHTPGHMVRCILEATARVLGKQMAALCDDDWPLQIRCAGGAARSDLWLQIKADVLGVTTTATACPEPTSLGAAMLAHAALCGAEVEAVAREWAVMKPPHRPDPRRRQRYLALYARPPQSVEVS